MTKRNETLISIQDKQVAAELKAIGTHGNTTTTRKVIFGARTRARKAIMGLGYTFQQAREAVTDAADMVALELGSR
jgi:Holliday junction resolvasome RuvABC DNA-binding subunit